MKRLRTDMRVHGQLKSRLRAASVWICLLSATGMAEAAPSGVGRGPDRESLPFLLPVAFSGVLPCADCIGLEYQLELRPPNIYFLRLTYLGKDGGPFDEIGRWSVSRDGNTLVLLGRERSSFRIDSAATLEKLDRSGREIDSPFNHSLKRQPYGMLQPETRMVGRYRLSSDVPTFEDCSTGLELPVASEGAASLLESRYRESLQDGAPAEVHDMFVTMQARVALRPLERAPALREVLVPVEVFEVTKDGSCDTHP